LLPYLEKNFSFARNSPASGTDELGCYIEGKKNNYAVHETISDIKRYNSFLFNSFFDDGRVCLVAMA